MLTEMTTAHLGPVTLAAPSFEPRHVVAKHGHLWQWVGDGEELVSLSVAVRQTRLGTQTGVEHHLAWEVRELRAEMDPGSADQDESEVLVHVDGATGSAAADLAGTVRGLAVHNRIIVTTEGEHMQVVRVLVPDNDPGRELSEAVTSSLEVQTWRMPA